MVGIKAEKVFTHTVDGSTVQIHVAVNEHDSLEWREAMIWGSPASPLQIWIDYLKLWRDQSTPKINQGDVWVNLNTYTPAAGGAPYSTDWASGCDASDDWKAELRYRLRRQGGTTTSFSTRFSGIYHTSC
jgi:hypothetical protein